MKTAVTYARFSCANQHESSIEAQRDAMARWCASRNVQIVKEYADRAASGTKVSGRDDFLQMLADLKTRRVDYVLVHHMKCRFEGVAGEMDALLHQRRHNLTSVCCRRGHFWTVPGRAGK